MKRSGMRLSTILSAYIGRTFLVSFLGVLAFIVGLILLGDTIELMRRLSSKDNADIGTVLTMALLKLPQMLHLAKRYNVLVRAILARWSSRDSAYASKKYSCRMLSSRCARSRSRAVS